LHRGLLSGGGLERKGSSSFLKKRTKKLLPVGPRLESGLRDRNDKIDFLADNDGSQFAQIGGAVLARRGDPETGGDGAAGAGV
jgi:hypothetical protein